MDSTGIKQISLGISYLILSMAFGIMLVMTFTYMPKSIGINYTFISQFLNYTWLHTILNFILSFFVGISLIIIKQKNNGLLIRIILAISGVLILLDSPPIIRAVKNLITNSAVDIPWTIILFGIHLILFVSLLRMTRNSSQGFH